MNYIEEQEYEAQLAHADSLIDRLVTERDRLLQENARLYDLVGLRAAG